MFHDKFSSLLILVLKLERAYKCEDYTLNTKFISIKLGFIYEFQLSHVFHLLSLISLEWGIAVA